MVGFDSLLLIGIAALLLFGPDKLPQYLRELGKIYAEIKKAQREFERELNQQQSSLVSKPIVKAPSDKVLGIARKMGIQTENKTEDQLLSEIALAVPSQPASPQEDFACPQAGKKDI